MRRSATVADDHGSYCVGCIDNVPIGLSGAANPAGCLEQNGSTGHTYTNTVVLTAPTEPGVYDIVAEANYTYHCSQYWSGTGTTDGPSQGTVRQTVSRPGSSRPRPDTDLGQHPSRVRPAGLRTDR